MNDDMMSFSEFAVIPQIPDIGHVRIAMRRQTGDSRYEQRVTEGDRLGFAFCEGNAQTLVENANTCARRVLAVRERRRGVPDVYFDLTDSPGQDSLDRDIRAMLCLMCLERASDDEKALRILWLVHRSEYDETSVADHLVRAL